MNDKTKQTTVSVDAETRDAINIEAEKLGLSQRGMVQRLIERYLQQENSSRASPSLSNDDIGKKIDRILQRDDRIVAFIKEQEKMFLTPILESVISTDARISQLVDVLSNLD